MLFGRDAEQAEIDRLLAGARAGDSGTLLLQGEAGVGKSALLEYAAGQAGAARVLRVTGIESETELSYAALQMLLQPVLDGVQRLPEPQANALSGALGIAPSSGPDRFLIGLATLTLLDDLASETPVLCLIDDAQWLDGASAEALLFVARRLQREGVVLLMAARPVFSAPGVTELRLGDLDRQAAGQVLDAHAPGLPAHDRARVLAEAAGNPLALRELPGSESEALSNGRLPLPQRILSSYRKRLRELPTATQTMLAVAAAEETGALDVILAAAETLGAPTAALGPAEEADLITVRPPILAFGHPLIRTATYQGMPYAERIAVHRALAQVTDPDRRAWHLALAATAPDEHVASALESAASRARERTGFGGAAAALARAAELTPDVAERGRRLTAAADVADLAGQTGLARTLAEQADRLITEPRLRADLAALRGKMAFHSGSLRTAVDIQIAAADAVAEVDADRAATLLAAASRAAFYAGEPGWAERAHSRLTRLALPDDHPGHSATGAVQLLTGTPEQALPVIRTIVARARQKAGVDNATRSDAASQAILAGDFEAARELSLAFAEDCRASGMIGWMPLALATLSVAELYLGRFRDSAVTAAEGLHVAEDTAQDHRLAHLQGVLAWLAAVEGDEDRCRSLAERCLTHFVTDYVATSDAWGVRALALLDLGAGRWEPALDRLDKAAAGPIGHQIHAVYFAPDQIEAAARLGHPEAATPALVRLRRWVEAAQLPWAHAVLHRCQALLAADDEAEQHFTAALRADDLPFEHARTELLYGEWLRRTRRRSEARGHLRSAQEKFERIGAAKWAERAVTELRATGETLARREDVDVTARLTAQELQVVRLAAAGATNKEIAARMFLSPKTVGHHLYRAFPKLGVSVRTELAHLELG